MDSFEKAIVEGVAARLLPEIRAALADVVVQEWLSPKGVRSYCGIAERTLEQWRRDGEGPPYIRKDNRMVLYRRSDLDAWLLSYAVVPK